MKKYIAIIIAAAAICCTACGGTGESSSKKEKTEKESSIVVSEESSAAEEESSQQEENKSEETSSAEDDSSEIGQDPNGNYEQTDTIAPGLWWSVASTDLGDDDYYRNDTYYEFREDGTGYALDQYSCQGIGFEYALEGNKLTLRLEISNDEETTYQDLALNVKFINKDNMEFSTYDGFTESLTYLSDEPIAQFEVYTTSELEDMAQNYFNASDGRGCDIAIGSIDRNDMVQIVLYEGDDAADIVDIYTIDRYTAKGTDSKGEEVDLLDPPTI